MDQRHDDHEYGQAGDSALLYGDAHANGSEQRHKVCFPAPQPDRVLAEVRSGHGGGGGLVWRRTFAGRGDQAAPARRLVRLLLENTPRAEDAEWVAAELISNALRHSMSGAAGGYFVVEVARSAHLARVVLYDLGGGAVPALDRGVPAARKTETGQREDGRGLVGVAQLAAAMGVCGDPITGHAVWAELSLAPFGDQERQQLFSAPLKEGDAAAWGSVLLPDEAGPAPAHMALSAADESQAQASPQRGWQPDQAGREGSALDPSTRLLEAP
ncbi:ATP-binding protein [Nonomuraea angiospora]|uniref:ATP-binding protein n=1 Tax=Nonomuraea angiospora TaxID=46172 RepID=UPI0033DBD3E6